MKTYSHFILAGLCILTSLNSVFGQSKFSLSINLIPSYSHSDSKQISPIPDPITQVSPSEIALSSHGYSYAIGLLGRYAFSQKWSASVGIMATHSLSSTGYFSQNGNGYELNYPTNHPYELAYSVPVLINYQSSTKRLSPYFSVGASIAFRARSYIDLGNGQEVPVLLGKPVVVSPTVRIGAIYRLNERLSVIAQPVFGYNVQAHPNYVYYHAYSVGLHTQLLYNF